MDRPWKECWNYSVATSRRNLLECLRIVRRARHHGMMGETYRHWKRTFQRELCRIRESRGNP